MNIYNLKNSEAKQILEKLDKKFGLVYTRNGTAAYGSTITAIIRKMEHGENFYVDIHSNYWEKSTILAAIPEFDDEFYLKER